MGKILKATYGSDETPLVLGKVSIPCYVLENGQRVFSRNGLQKAIGYSGTSGDWIINFAKGRSLRPHVEKAGLLDFLSEPIEFERKGAGGSVSSTYGYDATVLVDICSLILDANKAGTLTPKQIQYAEHAEVIIKAVAKVGIIALVDEATGYVFAKERAKDELQKFLEKALQLEAGKWIKTFQDEFFQMIFKMKGWTWVTTGKKPGVVGHYINDLVYSRIAPNLLKELRELNPKFGKGRKNKHHQHLTEQFGHPLLKEHIASLIALGKAASYNWDLFMQLVDKALPRFGQTLKLDFAIEYDNKIEKELNRELSPFDKSLKKALEFNPKKQ